MTKKNPNIEIDILNLLSDGKPRGRAELGDELSYPYTTIHYALERLIIRKQVEQIRMTKIKRLGRPSTVFLIGVCVKHNKI